MNNEIRYLAQHLLCAGVSPLSGRDRRVIQRVAHRTYLARSLNQVFVPARNAFDPYPFVFLNLLLSMLAALQAPVIMMSQNRQAAKDRFAAALDGLVSRLEQFVSAGPLSLSSGEPAPARSALRIV